MLNQKDLNRIEKFNREQKFLSDKDIEYVSSIFANFSRAGDFTCPICCKKIPVNEAVSYERQINLNMWELKFTCDMLNISIEIPI